MLYTLSTRAMLNGLGKCDVLVEAMQPFVHHQHSVATIKYREELRSCYAKFVYYVVRECHVSGRGEPGWIPVNKLKCLLQKNKKVRVFVWKNILLYKLIGAQHVYNT